LNTILSWSFNTKFFPHHLPPLITKRRESERDLGVKHGDGGVYDGSIQRERGEE